MSSAILEPTTDKESQGASLPDCRMTSADYVRLTKLVYETSGICLNDSKKVMVETRLRKRLRDTGASNFAEYWQLLRNGADREKELVRLIDVMSTNKTDFFREPRHFEYLKEQLLPSLAPKLRSENRALGVWSAGCSSGKEPYTLAMVLSDAKEKGIIDDFDIQATDISTDVLKQASRAVYREEDIEPIPEASRKKYLLRSRDRQSPSYRIIPELRKLVRFSRLNLMDGSYEVDKPLDIIFCRNVMIYFDRPTQEGIVRRFGSCLRRGGHFFLGHSESLNGLSTGLKPIAPTIYRKD